MTIPTIKGAERGHAGLSERSAGASEARLGAKCVSVSRHESEKNLGQSNTHDLSGTEIIPMANRTFTPASSYILAGFVLSLLATCTEAAEQCTECTECTEGLSDINSILHKIDERIRGFAILWVMVLAVKLCHYIICTLCNQIKIGNH